MFSKRKPEIYMAYNMLHGAMDIIYNYLSADDGIPLESKLKSFDAFVDELYIAYRKARKISQKKRRQESLSPLSPQAGARN